MSGLKRRRGGRGNASDTEESDAGAGIDDLDLTSRREEEQVDRETPAQKRLRLAKSYLAQVKADVRGQKKAVEVADGVFEFDAEDVDRELIAERLVQDQLESSGKAFHRVADALVRAKGKDTFHLDIKSGDVRHFGGGKSGHRLAVTAVAVSTPKAVPGARPPVFVYSSSKDASIIKWDFYSGKQLGVIEGGRKRTKKFKRQMRGRKKDEAAVGEVPKPTGHTDDVWCLAASSDGKFLASGGKDSKIRIFAVSPEPAQADRLAHTFSQHRDAIAGLAFRRGQNQLYSASFDRTVKVWNADEGAYIETLFGHQDCIPSVAALQRERCLTTGSRDRTLRLWKIPEESQLVYRTSGGGDYGELLEGANALDLGIGKRAKREEGKQKRGEFGGSLDCAEMIDEDWFLSGSDGGAISLWNAPKKKPVYTRLLAHRPADDSPDAPVWITALASLHHTDLFASGSSDGFVRLWKIDRDMRGFRRAGEWKVDGVVNALTFFEGPDWDAPETGSDNMPEVGLSRQARARDLGILLAKPRDTFVYLLAAIGDEHRLGRWYKTKGKNRVVALKLGRRP
ncbi:WD40-repeat-containing domain protein [Hyaloraphidium curvatum]|nr:WD40-repeat-containing domain protein [Hyaloraphidium curvatum]